MVTITLLTERARDIRAFEELLGSQIVYTIFMDKWDRAKEHADNIQKTDLLLCTLDSRDTYFGNLCAWLQKTFPLHKKIFIVQSMNEHMLEFSHDPMSHFLERPILKQTLLDAIKDSVPNHKAQRSMMHTPPPQSTSFTHPLQGKISSVTLGQEIARGGAGVVYMGYQQALQRRVAVKVLLPETIQKTEDSERLRQEALAISRLKHPHIVQCFDAGFLEDESFYIVMEFVPGGNLEQHINKVGRITELQALEFILQTARGLAEAHEEGIVHRDIKPSNLLLNAKNQITITDFGLAITEDIGRVTQTGMIVGTPHYLSPEQATGDTLDARTDIYSLGVVFYELLTGQLPVSNENPFQSVLQRIQKTTLDPLEKDPNLPEDLVNIIRKMTQQKAQNRYENVRLLIYALEVALFQRTFNPALAAELNSDPSSAMPFNPQTGTLVPFTTPLPYMYRSPLPQSFGSHGFSPFGGMAGTTENKALVEVSQPATSQALHSASRPNLNPNQTDRLFELAFKGVQAKEQRQSKILESSAQHSETTSTDHLQAPLRVQTTSTDELLAAQDDEPRTRTIQSGYATQSDFTYLPLPQQYAQLHTNIMESIPGILDCGFVHLESHTVYTYQPNSETWTQEYIQTFVPIAASFFKNNLPQLEVELKQEDKEEIHSSNKEEMFLRSCDYLHFMKKITKDILMIAVSNKTTHKGIAWSCLRNFAGKIDSSK